MISVIILLVGHFVLLIGLRLFFAMCHSKSINIHQFLHSTKFKCLIALYILFIATAITLPMVF